MIAIGLTSNAAAVLEKVGKFPAEMRGGIRQAMDRQNQLTISAIVQERLTGKGPFPPDMHKLGVVTNRLRGSLRAMKASVSSDAVISGIGTNVAYAGAHEFGFQGTVSVRAHQRHGTMGDRFKVGGEVMTRSQMVRAKLKTKKAKRIAVGFATVRAHQRRVDIPERAPIRTGIEDRAGHYKAAVSSAIVAAWRGGQP